MAITFLHFLWPTRSQNTGKVTAPPRLLWCPQEPASRVPKAEWGLKRTVAAFIHHECQQQQASLESSLLVRFFWIWKSWWNFRPWLNLNTQMLQRSLLSFPQLFPSGSQHDIAWNMKLMKRMRKTCYMCTKHCMQKRIRPICGTVWSRGK